MPETSNLARKHTHTYVVSENILFGAKTLLILLIAAVFFAKIFVYWIEIRNTPIYILPNIWILGKINVGMNVSKKLLLNAAKCQEYSFYRF